MTSESTSARNAASSRLNLAGEKPAASGAGAALMAAENDVVLDMVWNGRRLVKTLKAKK
jgi:hypothetical protein